MKTYSLADFGHIVSAKELVSNDVATAELPTLDEVKTLASWTDDMLEMFEKERDEVSDRSNSMMYFAYSCAEQGWSDEQLMAALYALDDRWGKYVGRYNRDRLLVDIINKARQKYGYGSAETIDWQHLLKEKTVQVGDGKLVYSWGELLASEFHIDWQLEGLMAQQGFGLLVAQPGVGKTQMAIQLGICLALGQEMFLERWRNVGGQRKVLMLSLEMGGPQLKLFQEIINREYTDDLDELDRNFYFMPLGENLALDTKDGQKFLDDILGEYMPDLLIIDSLQTAVSKELTDEQATRNFTKYLSSVRKRHNCSMLVIHHNRKASQDRASAQDLNDVYGSQFFNASVDFVIGLAKQSEAASDVIEVRHLKNRLGPEEEVFEVVRNRNLRFDPAGSDIARTIQGSPGAKETGGTGAGRGLLGFGHSSHERDRGIAPSADYGTRGGHGGDGSADPT